VIFTKQALDLIHHPHPLLLIVLRVFSEERLPNAAHFPQ